MKDVIIAGVIDTHTGIITETLTKSKDSLKLRLRVRDELNNKEAVSYKNRFIMFEFRHLSNVALIKRNMSSNDPLLTNELDILYCRYNIQQIDKSIEEDKRDLAIAKSAIADCDHYFTLEQKKLSFLVDATDHAIEELEDQLGDYKNRRVGLVRHLLKLKRNN